MKSTPIADLHCDMLSYLSRGPSCTAHDPVVRCSIPQMLQGGVALQTMAIFTETQPGSAAKGKLQADKYKVLAKEYPDVFVSFRERDDLNGKKIATCVAVENASSFAEEDDDLEEAFKALTKIHKKVGKIVYVSFTWNSENRFGGGAHTDVGLKADGRALLELLEREGIAVDLSHASDRLANEIFDYIDKKGLDLRVIASHSVMRAVHEASRNLPDAIAKEIIRRKGVIGLNFIAKFIGPRMDLFLKHLERLLLFGGVDNVCFGADFFYDDDIPVAYRTAENLFFPEYGNASTYPKLLGMIRRELKLPEEVITRLASENLLAFLCGW